MLKFLQTFGHIMNASSSSINFLKLDLLSIDFLALFAIKIPIINKINADVIWIIIE